MGQRYNSSDKFNLGMLLINFILGTFLSFVITGIAAVAGYWLFYPFAGIVLVFLSSWLIYWVQFYGIKISKNRNFKCSRISILISSILTILYHMGVVFSMSIVYKSEQTPVMLDFKSLSNIFVGGFLTLMKPWILISFFLSGFAMIIYMIIIIFSNIFVPHLASERSKEPFNEESKQWMKPIGSIGKFAPFSDREQYVVESALKRGDISPLLERPFFAEQNPQNYAQVVFYKAKQEHSGYVGVRHFHQLRKDNGEFINGKYQMIEFVPPVQIGMSLASKLEQLVNSASIPGFGHAYPGMTTEEYGYGLYRTPSQIINYDNEINRTNQQYTGGYQRFDLQNSMSYVPPVIPQEFVHRNGSHGFNTVSSSLPLIPDLDRQRYIANNTGKIYTPQTVQNQNMPVYPQQNVGYMTDNMGNVAPYYQPYNQQSPTPNYDRSQVRKGVYNVENPPSPNRKGFK